jgi:excisionase family DNA binding protein
LVTFQKNPKKPQKTRCFALSLADSGLIYARDTEIHSKAILSEEFPPKFALPAGKSGRAGPDSVERVNGTMADSREVMNIRQASQYLGVSPDTLYKYVGEQRIPAFKLGNRWRFKKSKLDQWMEEKSSQMEAKSKKKPKAAAKAAGE